MLNVAAQDVKLVRLTLSLSQNKNTQSGTEFAKTKEQQAAIMREKQQKGVLPLPTQQPHRAIFDHRDSRSEKDRRRGRHKEEITRPYPRSGKELQL